MCVCVCVDGMCGVWGCGGVCVGVCVSGYAFHHASRYGDETWHGDRGWGPEAQEHSFEVNPSKINGHPEVNLP